MEKEKGKIYFGHPVNTYNTEQESELVEMIERMLPEYSIENPNQRHHQEGYQRYKKEKGNGMQYYFEKVLPKMDAGIFLPFEDGMFGAGIVGEAEFLYNQGKPIYEIVLKSLTEAYPFGIRTMTLDSSRFLSVEETRERVYKK